jgi:PAS domain S-box-containing protein
MDGSEVVSSGAILAERGQDAVVRHVIERLGALTGPEFLDRLVAELGQAAGAQTAFVGALDPPGLSIHTIAVWNADGAREHFAYALKGSPCERAAAGDICVYETGVAHLFPDDAALSEQGIEGYAGAPIIDRTGKVIGLLTILSRRPLRPGEAVSGLLTVLATRVAVELAHLDAERELRAANDALRRARDEHAAAEKRFRDIALVSSDWFWEQDADLRFTYISDALETLTGVLPSWQYGKTREEIMSPDAAGPDRAALNALRRTCLAREPFRDFVYSHRGHDGVSRWMRISGLPVFDDIGRFAGYRGTGTEITALLAARELAEKNAQTLRDGIDAMTAGFALFDATDRLVLCNERYQALSEYLHDERVTGSPTFESIIRAGLARGGFADIAAGEAFVEWRLGKHRDPGGAPFEVRLRGNRWVEVTERRTADGGVVCIVNDITARKISQQRLLAAIEAVPVGFIMCDPDDRLVLCNQKYRDLYPELEPRLTPGTPFVSMCELCGDVIDADGAKMDFDVWLRERMARHRNPEGPHLTATLGGRNVLVSETRTGDGGYVGVHVDITPQMALQEQLADATRRAEEALEVKSQFLANMSHKLRTPLNAVIGFAELMKMQTQGPLSPRYVEFAGIIKQSGEFLLSLIVDILDMSRIEAHAMSVERGPVDAAPLVAQVATMLSLQASRKGVALRTDVSEDLPMVWAERRRLLQILQNVVSNAVKYTSEGSVAITARRDGAAVRFTVRDTGKGMTPEEIVIALTPFRQVRSMERREYLDGSGLGLPLVKALVDLHDGTLDIASEPGKGATVDICIPVVREGR